MHQIGNLHRKQPKAQERPPAGDGAWGTHLDEGAGTQLVFLCFRQQLYRQREEVQRVEAPQRLPTAHRVWGTAAPGTPYLSTQNNRIPSQPCDKGVC